MNATSERDTRPYISGSAAARALRPPLQWYERVRLFRIYRFFVPRMLQMTFAWLLVYTATAAGWIIYLRDVDNNATELDHEIALATGFYTLMLGVISFILVIDWSAGTVRYQTCATNFLAIVDLTSAFANTLVHNIDASSRSNAVASSIAHIQHVVRAIPYALIVFYRDINLAPHVRRAALTNVLRAIIPDKYFSRKNDDGDRERSLSSFESLEEGIELHPSIETAHITLYYSLAAHVSLLTRLGAIDAETSATLKSRIEAIGQQTSELTRTVRITYPKGAKNFVTTSIMIYLLFVPYVVYDEGFAKTLVLNAIIVFVVAGVLEIGRQIRDPLENLVRSPYSEFPLFGPTNTHAEYNDMQFDKLRRALNGGAFAKPALPSHVAYAEIRSLQRDAIGDEISGPFSALVNGLYDRLALLLRFDHANCSSQDFTEPPIKLPCGLTREC